eukprot:5288979-Prymnesium_polylepis.1
MCIRDSVKEAVRANVVLLGGGPARAVVPHERGAVVPHTGEQPQRRRRPAQPAHRRGVRRARQQHVINVRIVEAAAGARRRAAHKRRRVHTHERCARRAVGRRGGRWVGGAAAAGGGQGLCDELGELGAAEVPQEHRAILLAAAEQGVRRRGAPREPQREGGGGRVELQHWREPAARNAARRRRCSGGRAARRERPRRRDGKHAHVAVGARRTQQPEPRERAVATIGGCAVARRAPAQVEHAAAVVQHVQPRARLAVVRVRARSCRALGRHPPQLDRIPPVRRAVPRALHVCAHREVLRGGRRAARQPIDGPHGRTRVAKVLHAAGRRQPRGVKGRQPD